MTRNFVIPASFAPVAANKTVIREQPVTTTTSVAAVTTGTVKVKTATKDALKFSGHAKPNTAVLIYVFSEPLVLSTTSNSDGEWSYALQDPMAPGKHEAYAVVSKGDGHYERSSVFNFAIAKASAAPANPKGYSFKVESNVSTPTDSSYSFKLYIFGVMALLLLVMVGLTVWIRRRQRQPGMVMGSTFSQDDTLIQADSPAAPTTVEPTPAAPAPDNLEPPAPTAGSTP